MGSAVHGHRFRTRFTLSSYLVIYGFPFVEIPILMLLELWTKWMLCLLCRGGGLRLLPPPVLAAQSPTYPNMGQAQMGQSSGLVDREKSGVACWDSRGYRSSSMLEEQKVQNELCPVQENKRGAFCSRSKKHGTTNQSM